MAIECGNILKLINLISSSALACIWLWRFVDWMEHFWFYDFFVFLFMIFFATLLIICEFKPDFSKKHFGFLYVLFGRGLWNIFLGSITMFGMRGQIEHQRSTVATVCVGCGYTLWALGCLFIVLYFVADKLNLGSVKKDLEKAEACVKV